MASNDQRNSTSDHSTSDRPGSQRSAAGSLPVALVVGGGNMGADVAVVFARGGWPTVVVEPSGARRSLLPEYWRAALARTGHAHRADRLGCIASLSDAPWSRVAIVVENAPESLPVKQQVFAECVRHAARDTILASNSSSFPISAISQGLDTADRMLGLHFFLPAHVVPLVEVVWSEATAPEQAERLTQTMRDLGKVPVQVRRDLPGFLANRIQHAMAREAFALLEAGVASAEDIDAAVRFGFGFRLMAAGPVLQRDHAGLEVHTAAAATMYPSLSNVTVPSTELRDRVADGRLGMKTGEGFFRWTPETIVAEKARYNQALERALELLAGELPPIRPLTEPGSD